MKTFFLLIIAHVMAAQTPPSRFRNARWIDVAGASPRVYGVYHFRKTFHLAAQPASCHGLYHPLTPGANHLEVKFK